MTAEERAQLEEETRQRLMDEMIVDAEAAIMLDPESIKDEEDAVRRSLRRRQLMCVLAIVIVLVVAILASVLRTANSRNNNNNRSNAAEVGATFAPTVSAAPTITPSALPTQNPSFLPTRNPTPTPSDAPSSVPSIKLENEAVQVLLGDTAFIPNILSLNSFQPSIDMTRAPTFGPSEGAGGIDDDDEPIEAKNQVPAPAPVSKSILSTPQEKLLTIETRKMPFYNQQNLTFVGLNQPYHPARYCKTGPSYSSVGRFYTFNNSVGGPVVVTTCHTFTDSSSDIDGGFRPTCASVFWTSQIEQEYLIFVAGGAEHLGESFGTCIALTILPTDGPDNNYCEDVTELGINDTAFVEDYFDFNSIDLPGIDALQPYHNFVECDNNGGRTYSAGRWYRFHNSKEEKNIVTATTCDDRTSMPTRIQVYVGGREECDSFIGEPPTTPCARGLLYETNEYENDDATPCASTSWVAEPSTEYTMFVSSHVGHATRGYSFGLQIVASAEDTTTMFAPTTSTPTRASPTTCTPTTASPTTSTPTTLAPSTLAPSARPSASDAPSGSALPSNAPSVSASPTIPLL